MWSRVCSSGTPERWTSSRIAAKAAWDDDNVDGESSAEKILRLGAKPVDITIR